MSKDEWFREYERLYNEREAGEITCTDEELSEKASAAFADKLADKLDQAKDRKKYGP